jgi:hypothetical protein
VWHSSEACTYCSVRRRNAEHHVRGSTQRRHYGPTNTVTSDTEKSPRPKPHLVYKIQLYCLVVRPPTETFLRISLTKHIYVTRAETMKIEPFNITLLHSETTVFDSRLAYWLHCMTFIRFTSVSEKVFLDSTFKVQKEQTAKLSCTLLFSFDIY